MVFERIIRIGKVIVFDICTQAERGSQLEHEHENLAIEKQAAQPPNLSFLLKTLLVC
jgi:hypothetical protein